MPRVQPVFQGLRANRNQGNPFSFSDITEGLERNEVDRASLETQMIQAVLGRPAPRSQNLLLGIAQNSTLYAMLNIFFKEKIERLKDFLKFLAQINEISKATK